MESNEENKVNCTESNSNGDKQKNNNMKTVVLVILALILILAVGIGLGLVISNNGIKINNENGKTIENENSAKVNTIENEKEINQTDISSALKKYEEGLFYFYAPESWNCKIQKVNNSQYKLNANDEYYEVVGSVNDKEVTAFSIMITSDTSYDNSSWVNDGEYSNGKYIYEMQRFICRDNDGNSYNNADYKFEKEVVEALNTLTIKYKITNEYGSANASKTLEGKYFIKGEAGTSKRSYIYYIKDGNLCRTQLVDEFPTEILANYTKMILKGENKIYAYPEGESFLNNIAQEDDYIVYEGINSNNNNGKAEENTEITNISKIKYEQDSFYFYAPENWKCKIQKITNSQYKVNSDDEYYEITGYVNGKEEIAFSIMITSDTSYDNSSWINIGQYNNDKYIYEMQRFICRDNDGNSYNNADYKFEKEVVEALNTLTIKYKITNEYGSANASKTLEGKYFIKGEVGTSARSYIYYIKDGNLCRTSLTDGFSTDILANYTKSLYLSNDGKIHAYPQGNTFMNNIAQEDDNIVYEKIN